MVAEVVVDPDGGGTVAVAFHLDDALLAELDELGVDPTAELAAAVLEDDDWQLERRADGDDLVVTIERTVTDTARFGASLRELAAGLAPDDPALLVDVDVTVDERGGSAVEGTVGFRPPATAGATVDGEPLGPHGAELAAIVERAVDPVLVVTLPGEPTSDDADHREGSTLRWEVPVGAERGISARAQPPPWWVTHARWLAIGGAVVALLLLVTLLVVWRRRRRRRRAASAVGFV